MNLAVTERPTSPETREPRGAEAVAAEIISSPDGRTADQGELEKIQERVDWAMQLEEWGVESPNIIRGEE